MLNIYKYFLVTEYILKIRLEEEVKKTLDEIPSIN